ncbi:hypothetical protein [[Kitasatospora] papulosa]|uniref:hypothetical protein n=1 Tax=[Kitasatospora] papulosa TaxID=1464011 RepID=UPI00369DF4D7
MRGYRSVFSLDAQFKLHCDRGDFSCDELFTADEALLHRWTDRIGQVENAVTKA